MSIWLEEWPERTYVGDPSDLGSERVFRVAPAELPHVIAPDRKAVREKTAALQDDERHLDQSGQLEK